MAIFVFTVGIGSGFVKEKAARAECDSVVLKNLAKCWKNSTKVDRSAIAKQLVDQKLLIGKRLDNIKELLGNEDSWLQFRDLEYQGRIVIYRLGKKNELCIGFNDKYCAVVALCGDQSFELVRKSPAMRYINPKIVEIQKFKQGKLVEIHKFNRGKLVKIQKVPRE